MLKRETEEAMMIMIVDKLDSLSPIKLNGVKKATADFGNEPLLLIIVIFSP